MRLNKLGKQPQIFSRSSDELNGAYRSLLEKIRKIKNPSIEIKRIIEDRQLDLGCPFCPRTESIPDQMYYHITSQHSDLAIRGKKK